MRIVAGLALADNGYVSVNGATTYEENEKERRKMGCIVEAPGLYDGLTAQQNMEARALLVNADNAFKVAAAEQLAELPRREIATKALSASRLILVKNLEECVKVSNRYAPEHLIIQTRNARELVPLVQNAGSVFVGDWSPETGGDYATGTNHVLPTYGYAATYSSLGLADFTKRMTVQEMTPQGFEKLGPAIAILAHAEELDAHRNAVLVRMAKIKQSKE